MNDVLTSLKYLISRLVLHTITFECQLRRVVAGNKDTVCKEGMSCLKCEYVRELYNVRKYE